jgi:hypothetical protein
MRPRGTAVLVTGVLLLTSSAGAVAPRTGRRLAAETLTALPAAGLAKPLRVARDLRWSRPAHAAWRKLAATGAWQAAWDRATGVPSRIWGAGMAAPGSIASPELAAAFARAVLVEHLALLAPGAASGDFTLVANSFDGDIRSIGFVQKRDGRVVVGGQLSFRFKRDRLFVIGSEALPHVTLPVGSRARLARPVLGDRAATALRAELALPAATVTAPGDEVILPLVGDDAVLGYRLAVPLTIDGGPDAHYLAYADPATGATLAVQAMNAFAVGTVLYNAIDRYPGRPRLDQPAPSVHVTLNGTAQTTSTTGQVSWSDSAPQTVTTSVVGDLVTIVNKAGGGARATATFTLSPGGQLAWDASGAPEDDAQVQTYLSTNTAKAFARALDPSMPTLGEQITANVNIAQDCNAFFDGKTINFFHASTRCQNTGLIQDVVFHEFGHAVHKAEVIAGVGAVDGAMGEGAADFFAVQITGDPKMGRGFFYTDKPLRDLDAEAAEARWPQDIGEIHKTGIIFGGAFWDLRKALIAELGEDEGIAVTKKLFVGALRRSVSIPTSLIEVLATDDDDGDLANGTPHECTIRAAYGRHGLRTATGSLTAADRLAEPAAMTPVHIEITGLATRCQGDEIDHAELSWKPAHVAPAAGTAVAVATSPTTFVGQLPVPTDDKLLYQFKAVFKDGSLLTLPDNLGDPYYQLYQGHTVPLYCTSFEEGDPLLAGWKTGTGDGSASPWAWGISAKGATDPRAAFSGTRALIQSLDGDYPAKASSYLRLPPIEIGQWTDVRLQYRRWLGVEDSHFDTARITVGGRPAWTNYTADLGDASSTHHIDREWRFHDVELSGLQPGHTLDVAWELSSDQGLQFGGWALDDVCVVANVSSVCGDGVTSSHETCDDGGRNADVPNACRTWCQAAGCGDQIVDDGEACDVGAAGDGYCTPSCEIVESPGLGGCCSAQRELGGSLVLGALALGFARRRRRRGAAVIAA